MRRVRPPYLLEHVLSVLLSQRDQETVSGDLSEEFLEVKLAELGLWQARLWYARQVISFVPGKAESLLMRGPALKLLCACTGLAGGWLGMMDLLLRHTGYVGQIGIAAIIVAQALLTLAALRFNHSGSLRALAMAGSPALLWLAGTALRATFGGAQLEGYVLLIALSLIVQAVLTLLTLPRARFISGRNA